MCCITTKCKLFRIKNLRFLDSFRNISGISKNANYEIISDTFGMTRMQAECFTITYKIHNVDSYNLVNSIDFCKKLGFCNDNLLKCPSLLRTHPLVLEQRYLALQEGGFKAVDAAILSKFRSLNGRKVHQLKSTSYIEPDVDVANSFMKYFNPLSEEVKFDHYTDNDKWCSIHTSLIRTYLTWRLMATPDQITNLFRVHRMMYNKSIRFLCENLSIAQDLGFTVQKMIRNGYILHNYPKYPKETLREIPNLAGSDMRAEMLKCPKLMTVSARNIMKIYNYLKEHDIPDEVIRFNMSIFVLSPETVKSRLLEIERNPELRILKSNRRFINLIVHHKRIESRLTYLQQAQLKCTTHIVLGGLSVENRIRESKDMNEPKEVYMFVESLLKKESKEFVTALSSHPLYRHVPLVRIDETYRFLREQQFRNNAICGAVAVLLYPKEKLKHVLDTIQSDVLMKKPKLTQTNILNLAIYHMEKDHHFTGDGIWRLDESSITPQITNE